MAGKRMKLGDFRGEQESMKAIFGEEITGLHDDGFETSGNEYRIFTEVFYGNKEGKEHFVVESDLHGPEPVATASRYVEPIKPINVLPIFSCEHSTVTCHSSVKNLSREDSWTVTENFPENVVSVSSHVKKSSASGVESDLGVPNTKRIKLSHDGNPNSGMFSGPFKLDSVQIGQVISGPIVESSVQGNILNCYPLQQIGSSAKLLPSSEDSNVNAASPDRRDAKEAIEDTIIMSPVSQESSVSKLLVISAPIAPEKKPVAPLSIEETTETRCPGSLLLISNSFNSVQNGSRVNRDRLRWYMKHLLLLAGWEIRVRPRKDRPHGEKSLYISPGKTRTFGSSLPQAWSFCGVMLLEDINYSMQEDHSNQWVDIDAFWSDLSETLAHIEKDMQQNEQPYKPTSLRNWWVLLDPFVTVAVVEMLCRFKTGRAVTSVKGVLAYGIEKCSFSSDCKQSALVSKRRNRKKKDMNLVAEDMGSAVNELGSLDENFGPTCQLDGMCNQSDRKVISQTGEETQIEILNSKCLRSIGNDSCDSRGMCSTEWNMPKSRSKRVTRSLSKANFAEGLLPSSSQIEGSLMKISSAENPATSYLGASSTKMLEFSCVNTSSSLSPKLLGAVPWDKTISLVSNVEVNGVPVQSEGVQEWKSSSQPFGKLLRGDQLCRELVIGQQMPFLPPQEEHCKEGASLSEIKKVLSYVDMSGTEKVLLMLPELQSSGYLRSPKGKVFDFHTDDVTKVYPEILAHQKELNLAQGEVSSEIGGTSKSRKKSKKLSVIKISKCNHYMKKNLSAPQKIEEDLDCVDFGRNQESVSRSQLKKGQKRHVVNRKKKNLITGDSVSSSRGHRVGKSNKKPQGDRGAYDESVVDADNGENPVKAKGMGNNSETSLVCVNDESVAPRASKKVVKANRCKIHIENGRKRSNRHGCHIDDDDLLVTAIIKNKEIGSNCKRSPLKARNPKKLKNQKGGCRLLPRGPGKGDTNSTDDTGSSNPRTVLSWLIDMGVLFENDILQYRNPKDNSLVKDGWVTRDGISCKCCNTVLSVSEFKLHAGFKLYRPSLNICLERGKLLALCQLQAWSAEYKARKGGARIVETCEIDLNDDTCGLCGDGGDLICCENCPSTFHQECLTMQELPEGSWYCASCICEICGKVVGDKEASKSLIVLKCAQCEHKYHKSCIKEGATDGGEVFSDTWFCGQNCREVYSGLNSRVAVLNHIDDGFAWTLLRCIHGVQKVHSAQRFALTAECNTKLAVALTIMEECFLPMVDPRTGIDMIPHVLYNWGSNFARLNYQGFYTMVLEKGDKLISVASIRIHGVTVAEMPLIATCIENRRQGMCRRLMNAIEEMLISFKVERLVISAIPALMDTWTLGFGYKPLADKDKERFKNVNLMVFPGITLLEKRLYGAQTLECTQADHQHSGSSSMDVAGIDLNHSGTIARPGSPSICENSVNITSENHIITEMASIEVSIGHFENREGASLFQVNTEGYEGLPQEPDLVKHDETLRSNLSCALDRKDLNTLMYDLNLGPSIKNNGLSD